jgi:MoxR-like ATPase
MRIRVGYPDRESEREILRSAANGIPGAKLKALLTADEVVELQEWVENVAVDDALLDYILAIVERTRAHEMLSLGVSPRGAQALYRASQALAALHGRDYVIPDDIKRLAVPVFAHRVVVNTRLALTQRSADASDRILEEILTLTEVPL